MSSDEDLQSVVAALRFNNYISLVIATAVTYDYIITFPEEIYYIWSKPWSSVSAMFFVVRYMGLAVALVQGLYGSTFIPGPTLVSTVLFITSDYAFTVFLACADMVMILRVYAMYSRSKIVLGLLLVFYATTMILYSISSVLHNNPNTSFSMTTPQVLDMSFCYPIFNTSTKIGKYKLIPRLTLAAVMLALAVARSCMDLFQAYKTTKRWRVNQYISLLVREGVLYFFAHLFNNLDFGQDTPGMVMAMLSFISMFVLSPRFIVSIRELHLHSLLHVRGRHKGIDTGFGISKSSRVTDTRSERSSSVRFADVTVIGMAEVDEEMQVIESNTNVER
ncbi:hypothetical protein HD554DRAFT_233238 [Boletus coccyginus]|nr:hypothetical protein HD554DRAFT_233238 [Boletus coccyginus]